MCGPSSALKAINKNIQDFAVQVKSEAGQVFDASSTVFHDIMDSVEGIVRGGPSQYGYSAGEQSAKTAAAVNAGATEARNLKAAAASSAAAIGGGNTVTPAGATQAAVLSADQRAAADTAESINKITQEGFEKGYDEWKTGLAAEEKAPDVFNPSTAANENVDKALHEAETSQQNIDSQKGWWKSGLMKLGSIGLNFATGGVKGGLSAAGKVLGG